MLSCCRFCPAQCKTGHCQSCTPPKSTESTAKMYLCRQQWAREALAHVMHRKTPLAKNELVLMNLWDQNLEVLVRESACTDCQPQLPQDQDQDRRPALLRTEFLTDLPAGSPQNREAPNHLIRGRALPAACHTSCDTVVAERSRRCHKIELHP